VNNINVTVVHNVYVHPVVTSNVRISFHGGQGGIRMRPQPAELVAWHEPHAAPMSAQVQIEREASTNKTQFAAVNHGRPESFVVAKAVMADHNVRPVAPPPMRIQAAAQQHLPVAPASVAHPKPVAPGRPVVEHPAPGRAEAPVAQHPAPGRPEPPPAAHYAAPARPTPAERPAPGRTEAPRPAEHPAPSRPAPAEHPAPARQEAHPAPAKPTPERPAAHPQPKPKPEDEHPR